MSSFSQGVYVTYVEEGGPADMAGLHIHDKLLQVYITSVLSFSLTDIRYIPVFGFLTTDIHFRNLKNYSATESRR